jgi:hypothetical protein
VVLVVTLLALSLAACSGEGTPVTGPDKASCKAGLAPSDVHLPADNCGVQPLELQATAAQRQFIPHSYAAQSLTLDLYIEGDTTCGLGPAACGVDDNRAFVPEGSADPSADPSRNRVHLILDFASNTFTIRISPSCRIHPISVGVFGDKECFAPKRLDEGTQLAVSSPRPGTVRIALTVIQTNYPAAPVNVNVGEVHNTFDITPRADGTIELTGDGTNFPDLAIIHNGRVVCADRATHISNALFGIGPLGGRDYHCDEFQRPSATNNGGATTRSIRESCAAVPQSSPPAADPVNFCIIDRITTLNQTGDTVKVWLTLTDRLSYPFMLLASDFQMVDSRGQVVLAAEPPGCLTDSSHNFTVDKTFVLPVPVCFKLSPGEQPRSLQWLTGSPTTPIY